VIFENTFPVLKSHVTGSDLHLLLLDKVF